MASRQIWRTYVSAPGFRSLTSWAPRRPDGSSVPCDWQTSSSTLLLTRSRRSPPTAVVRSSNRAWIIDRAHSWPIWLLGVLVWALTLMTFISPELSFLLTTTHPITQGLTQQVLTPELGAELYELSRWKFQLWWCCPLTFCWNVNLTAHHWNTTTDLNS